MTEKNNHINDTPDSQKVSLDQASKMFDILFGNETNRVITSKLFEGLPGMLREQEINDTIKMAKGSLNDLKNTV